MKKASMRLDANGRSIQSLSPTPTSAVVGTIGAASVRLALPTDAQIVRVAASGNCYFAFGNSAVTATASDSAFPVGVELFAIDPTWTHVAFIREGAATGSFSVTEMA